MQRSIATWLGMLATGILATGILATSFGPTTCSADDFVAHDDWHVLSGEQSTGQPSQEVLRESRQAAAQKTQTLIEEARRDVRQQLEALRAGMQDRAHDKSPQEIEIQRLERLLEAINQRANAQHLDREAQEQRELQRRQQHIREAIKNLRAAGMHEQAERVQQAAREAIAATKKPRVRRPRSRVPSADWTVVPPQVRPTPEREAITRLRHEMNAIRGEMAQIRDLLRGLLEDAELRYRGDSNLKTNDHDGHDHPAEDHLPTE